MKQHRRFFACLLALIMVLACIPAASAAQIPEEPSVDPMGNLIHGDYLVIARINDGKVLWRRTTTSSDIRVEAYSRTNELSRQFRCLYVTTTNNRPVYALRPANNENYALTVNPNTKAVTFAKNPDIPNDYQRWYLSSTHNGDYLVCSSSNSAVNGLRLYIDYSNPSSSTPAISVNSTGTILAVLNEPLILPDRLNSPAKTYMTPGETKTFDTASFYPSDATPIPGSGKSNHLWFTYSSSNPNVLTVTETGQVTAVGPGSAYIYASHKFTGQAAYIIIEVLPLAEGFYSIRNRQTILCVTTSDYPSFSGDTLYQSQWSYFSGQIWKLEHDGNGYYTIECATNAADAGMNVFITATDLAENRSPSMNTEAAAVSANWVYKWKIEQTDAGFYKIMPQGSSTLVLSLDKNVQDDASNLKIKLETYTDDTSYLDEFRIPPC